MQKFYRGLAVGLPFGLASLPSFAAIDVSSVTTLLSGDVTTAVTSIGLAVLAVIGVVVAFKMIRRAM